MNRTMETEEVAKQYFAAWTVRDSEKVKALLDENLTFSFVADAVFVIQGRDKFLSGEAWPEGVDVTIVAEAYQNETAFQMYETRNGTAVLRVVEKFVVRNGRISDIVFVTDQAAYAKFKAG